MNVCPCWLAGLVDTIPTGPYVVHVRSSSCSLLVADVSTGCVGYALDFPFILLSDIVFFYWLLSHIPHYKYWTTLEEGVEQFKFDFLFYFFVVFQKINFKWLFNGCSECLFVCLFAVLRFYDNVSLPLGRFAIDIARCRNLNLNWDLSEMESPWAYQTVSILSCEGFWGIKQP